MLDFKLIYQLYLGVLNTEFGKWNVPAAVAGILTHIINRKKKN